MLVKVFGGVFRQLEPAAGSDMWKNKQKKTNKTSKEQQKAECKEVVALKSLRTVTWSSAQGSNERE